MVRSGRGGGMVVLGVHFTKVEDDDEELQQE